MPCVPAIAFGPGGNLGGMTRARVLVFGFALAFLAAACAAKGTGGATGTGGAATGGTTGTGSGGSGTATGGVTGTGDKNSGGCSCDLGPSNLPSTAAGLLLLAFLFLLRRVPEPRRLRRR